MELNLYLQKFQKETKKQSKESVLASEIYEFYKKNISYTLIMKLIKERGYKFVQENFLIAQKECWNIRLFMYNIYKVKIIYVNKQEE